MTIETGLELDGIWLKGLSRSCRAFIILTAVALLLSGCAAMDHISPRTAHFNIETSNAKSRSILANIVRAAEGQPLQFTDITTISGTGDIEGSLGAELPVAVDPSTVERTFTLSPSIKASSGNQFNVANLNTQEFYYGLQAPVKVEHIANFIAAGYDPSLVLFLMVDEIEVKSPVRRIVIRSATSSTAAYASFRQAIDFLLQAGLTTREGADKLVGPELSEQQIRDPRIVSTLLGTGVGKYSISEQEPSVRGGPKTYRLAKSGPWGFCFDPLKVADQSFFDEKGHRNARWTTLAGLPSVRVLRTSDLPPTFRAPLLAGPNRTALPDAFFEISPASYCDGPDKVETPERLDKVSLKPRSVEGIFLFLGSIARAQIQVPGALGMSRDAESKPPYFPFRVMVGAPPTIAALTIKHRGVTYSIMADPSGIDDQSTRVLQIMTDLLALQSSSKDLPAPSAISVITR